MVDVKTAQVSASPHFRHVEEYSLAEEPLVRFKFVFMELSMLE